jgi:multidrug efflux pump subunit AcrB
LRPTDPKEDKPIVLMSKEKFAQQCSNIAEIRSQEQEGTLVTLAQLTHLSDQEIHAKIRNLMPLPALPKEVIEMDGLPY